MLKLIEKEFILQKKMIWFGALYSVFLLLVFHGAHDSNLSEVAYIMASFGMAYIMIIGAAQAEYKNQTDLVLNSLPLTRPEIVRGKYLSVIVFTAVALAMVGAVGAGLHLLPGPFGYRLLNLNDIAATLISVLFLAAISLPAYFISGARWIQVVNMFIFMFIFFAPAQIVEYMAKNSHRHLAPGLAELVRSQPGLLSVSAIVVMLLLFFISYLISLWIYLRKDF